jgi:hypothetical protein
MPSRTELASFVASEAKANGDIIQRYERAMTADLRRRTSKHFDLFPRYPQAIVPVGNDGGYQHLSKWFKQIELAIKIFSLRILADHPQFKSYDDVIDSVCHLTTLESIKLNNEMLDVGFY